VEVYTDNRSSPINHQLRLAVLKVSLFCKRDARVLDVLPGCRIATMMYTAATVCYMNEYIGIAVSFVLAGGISALMVVLSSTLGKKNPTPVKLAPFECGKEPFSLPVGRFAIKFYLIGILFILFDVELVFLYPWAVVYRTLGISGLVEVGIFLGILMIGFVYAWDNGALNWQ
jgi:NADH-quinone oxidoreductase subunit A